jgi:phosphatidylserine/phosphatidylglycerophosphate/cardiolipin synthase-like enzyme
VSQLPEHLLDAVADVVAAVPAQVVHVIAERLGASGGWSDVASGQLLPAGPPVQGLSRLLAQAPQVEGLTPSRLGDLLVGASASASRWAAGCAVEVAWTGPAAEHSQLRRTEQALLDVLRLARERVWFVSFAAYRVASINDALLSAAARGVRVRLLLESQVESSGGLSSGGIESLSSQIKQACECYVWPTEQRPVVDGKPVGLVHAKAAVADSEHLFVSSANLTDFALEHNVELGLLVRSKKVAGVVEAQMDWLLQSKQLKRFED